MPQQDVSVRYQTYAKCILLRIEGMHAAAVTVGAILAHGYNVGISERFGSAVIRGK